MKQYKRLFILIEEKRFQPFVEAGLGEQFDVIQCTRVSGNNDLYVGECRVPLSYTSVIIRYGSSSSSLLDHIFVHGSDSIVVYINSAKRIHKDLRSLLSDNDRQLIMITSGPKQTFVFGDLPRLGAWEDPVPSLELRKGLYVSSVHIGFGVNEMYYSMLSKGTRSKTYTRENHGIKHGKIPITNKSLVLYSSWDEEQCPIGEIKPSFLLESPHEHTLGLQADKWTVKDTSAENMKQKVSFEAVVLAKGKKSSSRSGNLAKRLVSAFRRITKKSTK